MPPKGVCLQEEALWKAYHFECQNVFRENPVLASDKGRQVLLFVKPSLQRGKELKDSWGSSRALPASHEFGYPLKHFLWQLAGSSTDR